MMRFKFLGTAIATLGLLAASCAAQAADLPRSYYKAPMRSTAGYDWTGVYAGINGGYGWGTSDWSVPAASVKPAGWLVGGTLGFNYQIGSFVLGVEGDYDWADINDTVVCAAPFTCGTSSKYLATVRGRLGFAFDRWLPYVTGGAAFADINANGTLPALAVTQNQTGWTFGGGLEFAFLPNWSAKVEYLYVDLGTFDPGFAAPLASSVSLKENIVRAGINYKFSGLFSRY